MGEHAWSEQGGQAGEWSTGVETVEWERSIETIENDVLLHRVETKAQRGVRTWSWAGFGLMAALAG